MLNLCIIEEKTNKIMMIIDSIFILQLSDPDVHVYANSDPTILINAAQKLLILPNPKH